MKKRVIIGGGIAVAVLIAVLVLFRTVSSPLPLEQRDTVSAEATASTTFSALVTPITSQVFASTPDAPVREFTELATSTSVAAGTRIKTSETGRALVEGAHEAFLDSGAEIVIASADADGGSRIGLETGKTWSRVQKTFDAGEFYELETKNAVAVVRGTSFGLYFEHGDTTTLIVTEGEVHLIARDPQTGARLPDTEVTITPGKKAVRKGEEAIVVSAIADADKGEWFRFNNPDESTTVIQNTTVGAIEVRGGMFSASSSSPVLPPTLAHEEPLTLSIVRPYDTEASVSINTAFGLYGTGLDTVTTLTVGEYTVTDFSIISRTQIEFFLHRRLASGAYDVVVTNDKGETTMLANALRIFEKPSAPAPPVNQETY